MKNSNQNPWAGLASYEDPSKSERKLKFCGRDNDIYDVARMIDDNLLLILYGKSGIGKTSLLNAGVFPKLRFEQYLPVSLRLGTLEDGASYQEAIISAVKNAVEEAHGITNTYPVVEEQTDNQHPDRLWNYFARNHFSDAEQRPLFPVVVLDQFEEVLRNISAEHVVKVQTLLNQLQYLIDESHALSDCIVDGTEYFYDYNFRFVISIREDELYLLEDNIDDLSLSKFRDCRYRLRSLSVQGATEAILVPGNDCIAEEEKQDVVGRIIELSKRPQSNDIDTLLLSLVCAGTYEKKAGEKITVSDLAIWKSNPMEVYYQDATKGLNANQIRYIQQHLVREDGSRRHVDAVEVKSALGENTYHTLTQGENRMLVFGEQGQVELIHDQLALAVYEERKTFEEKEKKRKALKRGAIIIFSLFVIIILGIYYTSMLAKQKKEIDKSKARISVLLAKTKIDEDPSLTQRILLASLSKLNNLDKDPIYSEFETVLRQSVTKNGLSSKIAIKLDSHSVSFSPDGEFIAIGSKGLVSIVKPNGKIVQQMPLYGHLGEMVNTVVFSEDGKILASANGNHILLWNNSNDCWTCYDTLTVMGEITSIKFCNNDKFIITAERRKRDSKDCHGKVRFFQKQGKRYLCTDSISCGYPKYLSISPDGKQLMFPLSSKTSKYTIGLYEKGDSGNWECVDSLKGHNGFIQFATYSPDGKQIISASNDQSIRVWEKTDNNWYCSDSLFDHQGSVLHVSFSNDGRTFASASKDSTIIVWQKDGVRWRKLQTLRGHLSDVRSVSFNPKNNIQLVSVSCDGSARIWSICSPSTINYCNLSHFVQIDNCFITNDGKNILTKASNDDTLRLWHFNNNSWECRNKTKAGLCFHNQKNNSQIFVVFKNSLPGFVKFKIDNDDLRLLDTIFTGAFFQGHCSFNNDATSLVTINHLNDKYVLQYCFDSLWKISDTILFTNGLPNGVTMNPYGNRLLVSNLKGSTFLYSKYGNDWCLTDSISDTKINTPIYFNSKGDLFASIGNDGKTIILWIIDKDRIQCMDSIVGHNRCVTNIRYSEKGGLMASTSYDHTLKVWSFTTNECIASFEHDDVVLDARFIDDDSKIVSITKRSIYVWDFPPLQELIDQTRERFKDRPLTAEERRMYYLE